MMLRYSTRKTDCKQVINVRLLASLPIRRKRQQHVPRQTAPLWIARVHIDDAIDDRRTRGVERATICLDTVDRRILLVSIVIPKDLAIFGGIGSHVSIL